jgi:hypothetical protein
MWVQGYRRLKTQDSRLKTQDSRLKTQGPRLKTGRRLFLSCVFCLAFSWVMLIALLAGCGAPRDAGVPNVGEVQFGIASWYGEKFHGRTTASGEKFDMHKLTAAHKKLPLGTIVRVTNIKNGRTVTVKINDRGPYKRGRVIDLSYAAAKKIGMVEDGITRVRLEIIGE